MESKQFRSMERREKKYDGNYAVVSTFEKVLDGVIPDGRYQWTLLVAFLIPLALLNNIAAFNFILLMSTPKHHCHVPGRNYTNIGIEEWNNLTLPWEEGQDGVMQQSQCKMFNISKEAFNDVSLLPNDTFSTIECQHGWYFDNSNWLETPVTKFDWVCGKKRYVTMILSANMAGNAVGIFILPILSDRFGRKPLFYVALFLNLIFANALPLATSLSYFLVLKFLGATAFYSVYTLPYIIVIELCSNRLRTITTYSTWLMFILSNFCLSFAGWFFNDWKTFLLVTQLPLAIFIFYWRFLPESPRWLLSRGKLEECEKVVTKIAVTNGKEFTEEIRQLLVKASEEEKKKVPPTKIFTSFTLTKHLLLISMVQSLGIFCANSFNLNVLNLKGNIFINYLFLRSFEFPGDIFSTISSHFVGRRLNVMICMTMASVFAIAASFVVTETWSLVVMCGISKLFLRAEIFSNFSMVGELFPTPLRATAFGIVSIFCMAIAITSPSVVALGSENAKLPFYIIGALCITAVFIAFFLPETMGNPLPQTMKEAKQIGQGQSCFSFNTRGNAHKKDTQANDNKNKNNI